MRHYTSVVAYISQVPLICTTINITPVLAESTSRLCQAQDQSKARVLPKHSIHALNNGIGFGLEMGKGSGRWVGFVGAKHSINNSSGIYSSSNNTTAVQHIFSTRGDYTQSGSVWDDGWRGERESWWIVEDLA